MRQRPATRRPRQARRVQKRGPLRCTLRRMSHQPSSSRLLLACSAAAAVALSAFIAHVPAQAQSRGPARQAIDEAGAAAISNQLAASVARGDTPGVAALVVDRD